RINLHGEGGLRPDGRARPVDSDESELERTEATRISVDASLRRDPHQADRNVATRSAAVLPAQHAVGSNGTGSVLVLLFERQRPLPYGPDWSRGVGQGPAETTIGTAGRSG